MTKTSRATNNSGFSLLEVLIVIALIAFVSALGVSSLTSAFRAGKDSFPRHLALTLREARDRAMLRDQIIRLRLDLDKQEYWMEEAPGNYLLPKTVDRNLSERDREARDKADANTFKEMKDLVNGHQSMPQGLKIAEVVTPRLKDPRVDGVVDVYFYNNGSADGVKIIFEDEEGPRQALRLHPITGQSRVTPEGGAKR